MKVTMLPDFSAVNPYQWELSRALGALGVHVSLTNAAVEAPIQTALASYVRPDLLHLHWTHPYLGRSESLLSGLRDIGRKGIPFVWTIHNLVGHEGADHDHEIAVHREIVDLAHAVIVHCDAAGQTALDAYGLSEAQAAKLTVIPHGHYLDAYDRSASRSEARERFAIDENDFVFLFFGQVRPYKGINDLLDAFDNIRQPSARLMIAGAAPDPKIVDELRLRAGSRGDLMLHPRRIDDDEVQMFFLASDVVVLPYTRILTSGSAILAMSFGRPLIVPSAGCLPATIPVDAAVFYDPSDQNGLERAMKHVTDRDVRTMGSRARAAAEKLGWRGIAEETLGVYRAAAPDAEPAEPVQLEDRPRAAQRRSAADEVLAAAPKGSAVVIADCGVWSMPGHLEGRTFLRFLESTGEYWDAPWEGQRAVAELRRLRKDGASFFVLGDSAAWWLDHFEELREELGNYPVIKKTERLEVYDLR